MPGCAMAEESAAAIEIPKRAVPVWLALGIQQVQDQSRVAKPSKRWGAHKKNRQRKNQDLKEMTGDLGASVCAEVSEEATAGDDVAADVGKVDAAPVDVATVHTLASVDKILRAASNQANILKKRDLNHARLFLVMDASGQMMPDAIEISSDDEAVALLAQDGVGLVIVTGGGGLCPLSNALVEALQKLRCEMAEKTQQLELDRTRAIQQVAWEEKEEEENQVLRPVLFWKPTDKNGYLSNWGHSPFELRGHHFNCAEQYLMWSKADVMGDVTKAQQILSTPDPKKQKALGKQVHPWKEGLWRRHREPVMLAAARAKFSQNPHLGQRLLATHPRPMAEASPSDVVWGIGLAPDNPLAQDPQNWRGDNLLGRVLEEVREEMWQEHQVQLQQSSGLT